MKLNFEWDEEKAKTNFKKHGVSFEEAITVFLDPFSITMLDGFVKSRKISFFVIPAEAGIQLYQMFTACLDSGFHRSDDFLPVHHA